MKITQEKYHWHSQNLYWKFLNSKKSFRTIFKNPFLFFLKISKKILKDTQEIFFIRFFINILKCSKIGFLKIFLKRLRILMKETQKIFFENFKRKRLIADIHESLFWKFQKKHLKMFFEKFKKSCWQTDGHDLHIYATSRGIKRKYWGPSNNLS